MKTAYQLQDGEIIYTPTGEKVATWDGEKHRMARGFAEDHSESVGAWVEANLKLGPAVPTGTPPADKPAPRPDAYDLGREAALAKGDPRSNPYSLDTEAEANAAWISGFDDGAKEVRETPPAKPMGKGEVPPKPSGFADGEKAGPVVAWIDQYGSPEEKARVAGWRDRGMTFSGTSNEKDLTNQS